MKKFTALVILLTASAVAFAVAEKIPQHFVLSEESPTFSDGKVFENFELTADILTKTGAKGAIRFHTSPDNPSRGYAVAIDNDLQSPVWWRMTGSILGVKNVVMDFAKDGIKFNFKLRVSGAEIETFVDGKKVAEYVEPEKPFRLTKHSGMRLSRGTISFERNCGAEIVFDNVKIVRLPSRSDLDNQRLAALDEQTDPAIRLHQRDFPVFNSHVHLKGGLSVDWAAAISRKYGVNCAVSPNCGKDFKIVNDRQALDFLADARAKYPFLIAMQAEGREWYKLIGEDVREKFDFSFTDAMTLSDRKGARTHIWRPEEVDCPAGSEDDYAELIFDTIESVCRNEPSDIYANPFRMPSKFKNPEKYLTPKRLARALDAIVAGGKVLEINLLSKLPSPDFIKEAKARGIKFTFGSNNAKPDFCDFSYALKIVDECGLQASDIWKPRRAR